MCAAVAEAEAVLGGGFWRKKSSKADKKRVTGKPHELKKSATTSNKKREKVSVLTIAAIFIDTNSFRSRTEQQKG